MADDLAEIEDRLEQVLADLRAHRTQRQRTPNPQDGPESADDEESRTHQATWNGVDLEFLAILAFVAVIMIAYMIVGL